jgi:hypothetical protein
VLRQLKDSEGGVWTGRLRAKDLARIEDLVQVPMDAAGKVLKGMDLTDINQMQHFHLSAKIRREILVAWLQPEWEQRKLSQVDFEDLWEPEAVAEAMDFLEGRVIAFLSPPAQQAYRMFLTQMLEKITEPAALSSILAAIGDNSSTASPGSSS